MRRFKAAILCLLSFVLPVVAPAASSDYSSWRKSDGTPQAVMLSYYDGPDTRGFAWQTSTSVSSGALWLLKGEWDSATGNFDTNQVATATSTKQSTECYTHKAHVTGLAAGTWSYRLGTASHYAYGKFVVRDGKQPFVAVNITDIQLRSADKLSNWKNVVKAANTVLGGGSNADTIISCGDFFDQTNPSGYSRYVCMGVTADQARDEFADVAWTMVSGNHDTSYYKACCAENYDAAASSGGGCHSYDYGAAHVATIPYASSLSSGVEAWLKADLAAAQDAQWRILVMHFGPYTTADHGQSANATYVQKISGLCATYKVDLVLQGHDHTYSKTLPYLWSGPGYTSSATDSTAVNLKPATIDINGQTYYDNPEGTVYVSAGCAGDRVGENASIASSTYANRTPKIVCDRINVTSSYAKQGDNGSLSVNAPMFAVLTADDSTLKFDWYVAASATPTLFDTLRISKASYEPPSPPEPPPSVETAFNGTTVTTVGAVVDATTVPGELILVYTNIATQGSLTLPEDAVADILVVGGGGSGGTGDTDSSTANKQKGNGGSGGKVEERTGLALPAATYTITVGAGGAACTPDTTKEAGKEGSASSIAASGFTTISAAGGAGAVQDKEASPTDGSGDNKTSDITGRSATYSVAGKQAASASADGIAGADGTGNGGSGCGNKSSYRSGAGASGIVVVRISGFGEVTPGPDDPVDPPGGEPAKFCVTPYLQRPATDAMTIIFFTDSACTATTTCTPKNGGGETRKETTSGEWAKALTNNVFHLNKNDKEEKNKWNNSLYRHRVRFEGLKPNRSYDYTVVLPGGETYSNTFRTAPDKNTPIRFVSYADCETTSGHFANYTANLQKMQSRNPDLITTGGDLTARGGIQSHWDEFWMQNAGGNGIGYTDILGSIPMITPIGNHDLFDNAEHNISGSNSGWFHDRQGEVATEKFLSYFEHNSNGVTYTYRDGTNIPETRDMSQLFHREDYGPVTLIFLDTNNGQDGDTDADHDRDTNYDKPGDSQHLEGGMDRRKGARHPDFNPGSLQYTWLTNQLADAQQKSRFTFVFNHHCPYSIGGHNKSWTTGEDASALAVRVLTETMVRYGVDGWYCGHDELLEHSITNGYEILPNGQKRRHTLSIYDLGCSGDSARSSSGADNPLKYWQGNGNYGGTGSYGFLETDVTTNKNGQWTCTITPIQGSTGNPLSAQIVYVENPNRGENENDLVYAQASNNTGSSNKIDGATQTKPSDWLAWEKPPEGPAWDESVDVELTELTAADLTYNGAEQMPRLAVKAGDLDVPSDYYTVSTSPSPVKNAGSYSVTVTGTGNVKGAKAVSFKVIPAPVTVTANPASKEFGAANPQFDATVTGLQGDDTKSCLAYSFACAADESTPAGSSVDIMPTGAVEQGNYIVEYIPGKLTVTKPQPHPSETTAVTASITYGQMLSAANGSVSGTMTNAQGVEIKGTFAFKSGTTRPSSGTSTHVAVFTPDDDNYGAVEVNVEVTVAKATLTVKPVNMTVRSGDPAPDYAFGFEGFVNGDTKAKVSGKPVFSCDYTTASEEGATHEIRVTGVGTLSAADYDFAVSSAPATLTVTKKVDEGTKWQSSYTIQEGETTGVIWAEYDGKDRWWKLDDGDESIAAPEFVDANPNEPKMSGCHTNHVRFSFTGVTAGTTTWTAYTYTDNGQEKANTYPGYDKANPAADGNTYDSNSWSTGSRVSITITVTSKPPEPVETEFEGQVIRTFGATVDTTTAPGELILVYDNPACAGTLELPADAVADILVVGGGGAGAAAKSSSSYYRGNGGNGGGVTASPSTPLKAGAYAIEVGFGGEGKTYVSSTAKFTAGGDGGESSVSGTGFVSVKAAGGTGGSTGNKGSDGTSGSSAQNGSSDITGDTVVYGRGGPGAAGKSKADGTNGQVFGEGGGGSANGGKSGSGANGVVIVRILGFAKPLEPQAITSVTVTDSTYNGQVQTPKLVVRAGEETLNATDYEIVNWSPSAPKDAGTYTATLRSTSEYYAGEPEITFVIARAPATVKADDKRMRPGEPEPSLTATVTGTFGNDRLVYTLSRVPGSGEGDYTITPVGEKVQGNYDVAYETGTLTIAEIYPDPTDEGTITIDSLAVGDTRVFETASQSKDWSVRLVSSNSENEYPYCVACEVLPRPDGTAKILVTGRGSWGGNISWKYEVHAKSESGTDVTVRTITVNGVSAKTIPLTLTVGETFVTNCSFGIERTWKYEPTSSSVVSASFTPASNVNSTEATLTLVGLKAGAATAKIIRMNGSYSNDMYVFNVTVVDKPREPQPIVSATAADATYNGQVQTPVIVVKAKDGSIVPANAYTVGEWSPSEPKKPGTYTATVTGTTESYYGEVSVSFTILSGPKPTFSVTPYLQRPAPTEMTVRFFTSQPCEATVTCGGRTFDASCEEATELVKVASDDQTIWGTQYRHDVRLTGLSPNTTYEYEVALDEGETYRNTLHTAPADIDTPIRFVAYSDSETVPPDYKDPTGNNHATDDGRTQQWDRKDIGDDQTYHVSRSVGFASNLLHMASWKPDFYVIAGDIAARGGVQLFWDEFWKENAGGLGRGYGDPAGAAPVLAVMGNHDHYDNKGVAALNYNTSSDEIGLKKYLTYFTFDPNGVDYASSSTERDSRDKSQLFHRLDYGPVTVLFLDTNKGGSAPSGSRAPSFDKGSLQYQWIERNLRDARDNRHSRFIFVVSHQDPYSCGKHNKSSDVQSTANVRAQLTDLMLQYGVTGWLAGHDEMQEHAQVTGSGHTMHVYDLGSAGDGLKGVREYPDNAKYITYAAYFDSPDGTHYGHLQVEVAPSNGVWYCTMTPAYSYFASPTSPSEYRQYEDKIVIAEGGKIVYEQRAVPDEESVTLRLGETVTRSMNCDSACYWTLGGSGADATFEHLDVSANGSPKATSAYTDYSLRTSSEISTLNVTLTGRSVGTETVVLGRDYTPDNPKAVRILHVTVLPLELTEATAPNQTYTGKVLSPSVTVKAGTRTLSASDYEIVNWSGDRINAGTYTATVRGMGDFGGEVPLSFTIDPKPVTVEANPLSKEYGTDDPKLTATVKGLVDGESAEDLIKYDISREAGEDYGTYFITPSGDAVQGNYAVAYQTALFTITKAQAAPRSEVTASLEYGTRLGDAQVVGTMEDRRTHTEVQGVFTFGDEDRILSVSDSGVQCAATFTPDKEFEGNYDPTQLSVPVTVRKRPLTVKAVGQSISYGDAKPSFGYLLTGFVPGQSQSTVSIVGEPTFDCTYEPGDAVGEYDVALVSVEGLSSANYSFVADPTVAKLIVVRKEVTVTPVSTNKVYRAAEPTLTAKVEGLVLDQGEDLIVFELSREADEDAGEYEIVAVGVAEQGNYHVTFRTEVFTIEPAVLTEASVAAQTYTGAALTPVLTVLAGTNTVPSAGYTVDEWNPPALLDAGTYTATVKGRGNFTGSVEVSFVVRKATIRTDDIVFEDQTVTYNGKPQSLAVANLPSGITVTYKGNGQTNADTYEVTAMFAAEDSANYAVSLGKKKATLKIEPAEVSSAFADAATYTGTVQTPTLTVRAGALTLGTDDYDIADWDPESPKDADSYTAKVVGKGNYTGSAGFSFRINPAKVTVTADDKEKNYGEDDPEFTATVTGMVNGESASILAYEFTREKAGTKEGEAVGYYTITPSGKAEQENYHVSYLTGKLRIGKTQPRVKDGETLAATLVYGQALGAAQVRDVMVNHNGKPVAGSFDFGANENRILGVKESGEYAATFVPDDAENYTTASVMVRVTVEKAVLTVSAAASSVTYGEEVTAFKCQYSGFVAGENASKVSIVGRPTYSCTYTKGNPVSSACTVSVTDIGTLAADNYTFEAVSTPATLTVTPRPVTVTSENATKTYGTDDPPFTAKLGNVLSGEENKIEYGFTRVEGEDVKSGGYRITPTGETDQGNYSVTFVPEGVLTINPAKITSATAPDVEYQNATISPVLTVMAGELTVPSEAYSVGTWTWSKTAQSAGSGKTALKTIGKHTATVTAIAGGNFTGSAPVSFEIVKANYDMSGVTFADQTVVYDGKSHSIEISGTLPTKGVTTSAKLSNPVYTGSGTAVGEYEISVTFTNGDANHYNTPALKAKLTIIPAPIMSATAVDATYTGKALSPAVTVTAGSLTLSASDYTIADWSGDRINAGEYRATVTGKGNFEGEKLLVFKIVPAAITDVSVPGATYTGSVLAPVLTVKAGMIVLAADDYELGAWNPSAPKDVGTYTATVTGKGNFKDERTATFVVSRKTIDLKDVVFADETVTYDAAPHSILALNVPDGVLVTYEGNGKTDAGTYTVKAKFAAEDPKNFAVSMAEKSATLTIEPAPITSADVPHQTYTGKRLEPKLTVKAGELTLSATDYALSPWQGDLTSAGTNTATVSGLDNFSGTTNVVFIIDKAPLTVAAENQGVGAGEQSPPPAFVSTGFVNGEDESVFKGELQATYHPDYTTAAVAGATFEIEPFGVTADNYAITFVSGVLEVGKSTPKLKSLTAKGLTYGQAFGDSELTGEAYVGDEENVIDGKFTWENAAAHPAVREGGVVGSVLFTPSDLGNYMPVHFNVTVQVSPAKLTVSVADTNVVYGSAAPLYSCLITGFVNDETDSVVAGARKLVCAYRPGDDAGTYDIMADETTFAADNYTFEFLDGELTVRKRTLTVSAKDRAITYGDPVPEYTYGFSGFFGDDNEDLIEGKPVFICTYTQGTKAGPYDISVSDVSGLSSANYDFEPSDKSATLTVRKRNATVAAKSYTKEYGEADPAFEATVTGLYGEDALSYAVVRPDAGNEGIGKHEIVADGAAETDNYLVSYTPGTLTIGTAQLTTDGLAATITYGETLGDAALRIVGKVKTKLSAQSADVPGTFSFPGEAGERPTVEDGRTKTYFVTFTPDDKTVYRSCTLPLTVIVNKKELTVKADARTITYGEPVPDDLTYAITGFIDGDDESAVSGSADCSCAYKQYDDIGDYPITVDVSSLAADNYVFTAADPEGLLTVEPAPARIVAQGDATKVYNAGVGDPDFTATTEGTFNGDELTNGFTRVAGENVGTYVLTPTGDAVQGNYKVTYVDGLLTITPATITRAYTVPMKYTGDELTPAVTVKAGDLTLPANGWEYETPWDDRLINAREEPYYATVKGVGNFTGTANVDFSITKATCSMYGVSFQDASATYDGQPHSLSVSGTVPDGLTVTYENNGQTAADVYTVTAVFTPDKNHEEPVPSRLSATLTVKQATITRAEVEPLVYNGEEQVPTVKVWSGTLEATFGPVKWSATPKGVGRYTATVEGNGNFTGKLEAVCELKPATVTIAADRKTMEYGTPEAEKPELTATVTGIVEADQGKVTIDYVLSCESSDEIGVYEISATYAAAQGNYAVEFIPADFEITVATPLVDSAPTATITYGETLGSATIVGAMKNRKGESVAGTFAFGDALAKRKPAVAESGAYPAVFTPKDTGHYGDVEVEVEVEVRPATLTVVPEDKTVVYGDDPPDYTWHYEGFVNGDTAAVVTVDDCATNNLSCAYAKFSPVDDYDIAVVATNGLAAANYVFVPCAEPATLTVTRCEVTVTAVSTNKLYGAADPEFTVVVSGCVDSASIAYSVSRVTGEGRGEYDVNVTGDAVQGNYSVLYEHGHLTVLPRPITSAIAAPQVYDGMKKTPVLTVTADGYDGVPSFTTGAWSGGLVEAGTYTAIVSGTGNFTRSLTVTFTITPKPATVTAKNAVKTYGEADPKFEAEVSGTLNGETLTNGFARAEGEDVRDGGYEIRPTGDAVQGNYAVTYQPGTMTITKAQLTVSPVGAVIRYGDDWPSFGCTYATFAFGDNESVVSGACTFRCDYEAGDAPGDYDVFVERIDGLSAANYAFVASPSPATLRVLSVEESSVLNVFEHSAEIGIDPATGGWTLTLTNDLSVTVELLDDLGDVDLDLNGHEMVGTDGVAGEDGEPAIRIVASGLSGAPTALVVRDSSEATGWIRGGRGGDPSGCGGAGISVPANALAGVTVTVADAVRDRVVGGEGGSPDGLAGPAIDNPLAPSETFIKVLNADSQVKEGESILIRVDGGNYELVSSVQLQAIYNTAAAEDLDLKNAKVNGERIADFKFPYTIGWSAGDRRAQVVEIPVRKGDKDSADEFFTFALKSPKNMRIAGVDEDAANGGICTVTIVGTKRPSAANAYVRAVANDATRGTVKGSKLVTVGTSSKAKTTLTATPAKGFSFLGWFREGDSNAVSRAASYAVKSVPAGGLDLLAQFVPATEDYLEVEDGFLPVQLLAGRSFSTNVAVRSLSLATVKVTGLPTGLKWDAKKLSVSGKVASSAKGKTFTVKLSASNLGGYKVARTYKVKVVTKKTSEKMATNAVQPYRVLTVVCSDACAGSASGTGVYQAGKSVKLTAKAASGHVFVGWHRNGSSNTVSLATSYTVKMPTNDVVYEARFAIPADDYLEVEDMFLPAQILPSTLFSTNVAVRSLSLATVKVTGLPTGLKWDAKKLSVSGKVASSAKGKTFTVTLTASNLSGYKVTRTYKVKVVTKRTSDAMAVSSSKKPYYPVTIVRSEYFAGSTSGNGVKQVGSTVKLSAKAKSGWVFAGWYTNGVRVTQSTSWSFKMPSRAVVAEARFATLTEDRLSIVAKIAELILDADHASLETNVLQGVYLKWKVTPSSLSKPKSVTVTGCPAGLSYKDGCLVGAPTAVSTNAVKIKVSTTGGATRTYTLILAVGSRPAFSVGTYNGVVIEKGVTNGTVSVTVKASGAVSGSLKLTRKGKAKSFSLKASYLKSVEDGSFAASASYKDGTKTVKLSLQLSCLTSAADALTFEQGVLVDAGETFAAYQNLVKGAKAADFVVPGLSAYPKLVLAAKGNGVISIAGKVKGKDGKYVSVSGSSQIYWDAVEADYRAVIYLPPKTNFSGLAEVVEIGVAE